MLQQGLTDAPSDDALLDEIERLAPITGNWEGAAAALRDAIDKKSDLVPDVARDLSVRVAVWYRDRADDPKAAEKALEKALVFDPNSDEVLVQIEQLEAAPGRERDLVQTLRRRAKLQLDDDARVGLYRRARDLAEGLGDRELAESVLRELLAKDDMNSACLSPCSSRSSVKRRETPRKCSRSSRGGSISARDEAENRTLRHKAAGLTARRFGDPAKAVEIYARLFEDDPSDVAASQALRELYEASRGP